MQAFQKVPKEKQDTPENEIRVAVSGEVSDYFGYASRILNKSDHKTLTIRATGNAIVKAIILTELVKRRIGDLHQINKIHSLEIVDVYQPKVQGMDPIEQKRRVTAMDTILSKEPLDTEDVGYQQPEPKEERVPQTVDGELEKQANRQKKDKQKRPPRKKTNFNEDPNTKIEPKQKPNKDKKNKKDKEQDKKESKDDDNKKDNKRNKRKTNYNDDDNEKKPKERRRGRGGRGRGGTYRDDHDREHHRRERDAIDYPNYDYGTPARGRRGMRGGPDRGGRPVRGRGGPAYHDQPNALPPPQSYHDDFYVQPRTRGYYPPMGDLYSGRPQRGMRSRGRAMRGNRGGHDDMYHREEQAYMYDHYPPRGRGGDQYGGYQPMRGGYPNRGRGDMYQGGRGRGGDFGGYGGGRGRGGPRGNYNDEMDGFDRMPRRGGFNNDDNHPRPQRGAYNNDDHHPRPQRGAYNNDDHHPRPQRGAFNNDDHHQTRPQRNYQNDDKPTGPNFYEPGQAIPRGRGRGVVRGSVDRRPSGEDMDHERSGDQDFAGRGMRGRRGMRGTFRGDMKGRGMPMSQPFYQTEEGKVENNDQPTRGGMGARGGRGGTNFND